MTTTVPASYDDLLKLHISETGSLKITKKIGSCLLLSLLSKRLTVKAGSEFIWLKQKSESGVAGSPTVVWNCFFCNVANRMNRNICLECESPRFAWECLGCNSKNYLAVEKCATHGCEKKCPITLVND
jgi:hypothetical protein